MPFEDVGPLAAKSEARIAEIYDSLGSLSVEISDAPTEMGPEYIPAKSQEILVASSAVTNLLGEAQRAFADVKSLSKLRRVEAESKVAQYAASPQVRQVGGSRSDREALAATLIQQHRYEAYAQECLKAGREPLPTIPTLQEEYLTLSTLAHQWQTLIRVLKDRLALIRQAGSAIRLQQDAILTTVRAAAKVRKSRLTLHQGEETSELATEAS